MINQTLDHITQSGTSQEIDVIAAGTSLTAPQFYSCLFCFTLITVVFIIYTTKLLQTLILKLNRKDLRILKKEILAELIK